MVEYDQTKPDGLQKAVSAAMGVLEANGYGSPVQMGALLGFGFAQVLRDARSTLDPSMPIYGAGTGRDPLYGISAYSSTNLDGPAHATGAGTILGFVAYRPNIHVRIRKDVAVTTSSEATVNDGTTDRHAVPGGPDRRPVRDAARLLRARHQQGGRRDRQRNLS